MREEMAEEQPCHRPQGRPSSGQLSPPNPHRSAWITWKLTEGKAREESLDLGGHSVSAGSVCPRAPMAEVIAHGCRFSVIDQEHVLAGLATDRETAKVQREARLG